MTAAPPTVMPILATPLGVASIPDSEQINSALRGLFAQRIAADNRPQRNPLRFSSADDLMEWPQPPARQLAHAMMGAVYSMVGSLNEFTEAQLRSFKVEARAWFTVVRTNGSVPAASYPLTSWCAIYCVTAPPLSEDRADSGVVRLYESRLGTMFQDATNSAMSVPYSPVALRMAPGGGRNGHLPGFRHARNRAVARRRRVDAGDGANSLHRARATRIGRRW